MTSKKKNNTAGNKTTKSTASVSAFLASIEDDQKRKDAKRVGAMMKRATGLAPKMWGASIVGYGETTLTYESGRVVDWFYVGYSPRKQKLTLYIMDGFSGHAELMKRLGKHKTGKSCLYIKQLTDVDEEVLETLIEESVAFMKEKHG